MEHIVGVSLYVLLISTLGILSNIYYFLTKICMENYVKLMASDLRKAKGDLRI